MGLGRGLANEQLASQFGIGKTLGDEPQDFQLPGRQVTETRRSVTAGRGRETDSSMSRRVMTGATSASPAPLVGLFSAGTPGVADLTAGAHASGATGRRGGHRSSSGFAHAFRRHGIPATISAKAAAHARRIRKRVRLHAYYTRERSTLTWTVLAGRPPTGSSWQWGVEPHSGGIDASTPPDP